MKKTALIFFFSIFSVTAAFSLDMAAISDSEASQTDSTYNLGNYYFSIGKYADAAKYLETAIYDVEKFGELYENILNMLSECYIKTNDQDGITRTFARVEEYNQHELQKDCADPECLREHAEYYMLTGDNAKAKENYFTLLAMPLTDEEKVDVYVSYAKFLGETDNYASGAEYFHLAANARKTTDGVDDVYIQIVYSAAQYNFIGKQPEKAIDDFKEVLVYYSQMDNCETLEQVANCHSGIGNSLSALAKYDEAKEEYQLAVAYYQKYDQQNDDYPKAIVNLADVENNSGQYEAAIAHYREAMDIYQQRGMADELGNVSNLLNLCYAKAGMEMENDEEIQNAAKNARNEKMDFIINDELANLELNRTYLGEYIYANSLATIAGAYDEKEDFDNAVIYYRHYVDAIRNAVRDEFRMMSENERMLLWNTQKDNINDLIEMPLMLPDEKNYLLPELSSIIYDAVLLSKGILLNSSIEFGKVLYETGDKHLQDVYKQTLQNGAAIDDMRKTQADNEDILSLIRENQTLQLELYKGCAEYADFTDYISYKWQDVQDAMSDDDVVVEFSYVDTGLSDDFKFILAVAMTKTQGPMAYVVCDQVKAKLLQQYDSLYEKDEIGDLVWGEIAQYFNGKKRLFFSADGIFNNIGIEYLQYNGKPLSDQMEVYRLSSTKELCRKHDKTEICNVALFGGINYFGLDQLSAEKEEDLRMLANDDMMRYALSKPLPNLNNTLREVQQIEQICMEKEIPNVLLFTASEASENAFRKLDNSKINLFHIATHGRYKDMEKSSDDDAMTNSILVFAGANTGGDNTDNNDGIISAADVAQMNLRLCDLAVLSACETGLGKLGDDGVFGLQRGFKNAGVHSLLMALKPVNDKATTELMLSFYSYLMNGKSKREALSLAQHDLRAKGFSNSKYWATFILLDGLD